MPSSKVLSYKKKRLTSADIKKENAAVANRARMQNITPVKSSVPIDDAINTVAIMPTPTRQKQNDRFAKVTSTRLNMTFRSIAPLKDNYQNMIPQISKEINSNFCIKYKRKSFSVPLSRRRCTKKYSYYMHKNTTWLLDINYNEYH